MNFISEDERTPIISVVGVGGGGSNAVKNMYNKGISEVNYVICNTDSSALESSPVPIKVLLGEKISAGDGAGNKALNGEAAAIESLDEVMDSIDSNSKMVFLTAGMGAGTGTGATPIIAKALKERGILTIAIVTIPFRFEGPNRIKQAAKGIIKLERYVDSLIIVDNERIFDLYPDIQFTEARSKADEIVSNSAKGIVELITLGGYVNVDFEDVKTVMTDSGVALMGSSKASGEERAINSIKQALKSPLLENNNIEGAKYILLNIISSSGISEIKMDEVYEITDYVISQVGRESQVIWGLGYDDDLGDEISVTIVATAFKAKKIEEILKLEDFNINSYRNEVLKEINKESNKVISEDIEESKTESFKIINSSENTEDKTIDTKSEYTKNDEGANNASNTLECDDEVLVFENQSKINDEKQNSVKQVEVEPKVEFFRGQIVMHPDMRERDIEQIEKIPAYERHKKIII